MPEQVCIIKQLAVASIKLLSLNSARCCPFFRTRANAMELHIIVPYPIKAATSQNEMLPLTVLRISTKFRAFFSLLFCWLISRFDLIKKFLAFPELLPYQVYQKEEETF